MTFWYRYRVAIHVVTALILFLFAAVLSTVNVPVAIFDAAASLLNIYCATKIVMGDE